MLLFCGSQRLIGPFFIHIRFSPYINLESLCSISFIILYNHILSTIAIMTTTAVPAEARCPCCDNPWSRATGAFFAQMCAECETADKKKDKGDSSSSSLTLIRGLDRTNIDLTTDPTHNFYQYANGNWRKQNPIPAGYPSWNTFMALNLQSQERCKELLEELVAVVETNNDETNKLFLSPDKLKLATFYAAAMDQDKKIESLGKAPLQPVLELIDTIQTVYQNNNKDWNEYTRLLGTMACQFGIYPFFNTGPSPDANNSDHTLCNLLQGGLGLPDRDYYFDEDKQDKREAYKKHIANMLTLLDNKDSNDDVDNASASSSSDAAAAAQNVYDLEVRLAEAHMTRIECRDPVATYNKMSIADLTHRASQAAKAQVADDNSNDSAPCFDFASYLLGSTGKSEAELGDINVRNVAALERVAQVACTVEPETLVYYLKWRAVSSCAAYLSKPFVDEDFDFYERILTGTQEIKPRWKRAMGFVEKALGEALGQIYCAHYFDEECKTRAVAIVEAVRQALEDRLKEVEWMKSESTREEALKKMSRFRVKIGYPNKWIDYSSLQFSPEDNFLTMVFKSRAFAHAREVKEMNAPTDREKWVSGSPVMTLV